MTTSLKKAFSKATSLPPAVQDQLAEQLLEDIEGELQWDHTLATEKSQNLLEMLAAKAGKAKRAGKIHKKGFDAL